MITWETGKSVAGYLRTVTLRAARLTQRLARSTLRYLLMPQAATHGLNRSTTTLGVHKFGREASFKI